ncbi:MAG: methionine biosynthesis protein MetW [Pseudomonadota bacterium]
MRSELELISSWIKPGSRVLDLGCGDGTLLKHLQDSRNVTGYGLEIDSANIQKCIEAGINVIQTDLDAGLSDFDEDSFDYVVMTQTLQAVHFPDRVLDEMLRIGREGIVTFPNFGHWRSRLQLLWDGRMPVSKALPNQWFNTPNIHLCTLRDFEELCEDKGIRIIERIVLDTSHHSNVWMNLMPNLFGELALYRFRKK